MYTFLTIRYTKAKLIHFVITLEYDFPRQMRFVFTTAKCKLCQVSGIICGSEEAENHGENHRPGCRMRSDHPIIQPAHSFITYCQENHPITLALFSQIFSRL